MFKHFTTKFQSSLLFRSIITLVSMISIVLAIGFGYIIIHTRDTMSDNAHESARRSMDAAMKDINNRITNIETALTTIESYTDLFAKDDKKVFTLLSRLIQSNPDITGATMLYKENFFPAHGKYFAPTAYMEDEKIVCTHIDCSDFPYFETDSNWIYTVKGDAPYWCLAYTDTMATNKPMVCYSIPLHDNDNNIYAILCADVELGWVWDMVYSYKPIAESRVSIIGRSDVGYFMCDPSGNNKIVQNKEDLITNDPNGNFSKLTEQMIEGKKGVDTIFPTGKIDTEDSSLILNSPSLAFFAPIDKLRWSVCFAYPISAVMKSTNQLADKLIQQALLILLILIVITIIVIRRITKPLTKLAGVAQQVAQGNFDSELPDIKHNDEIKLFRDSFSEMQKSLSQMIEQLKVSTEQRASIEKELHIAAEIQANMVPQVFPDHLYFDMHAILKPAKEIGGDLYDYSLRNNKLFFCLGDVSGKGMPAALFMAITRSLFHNLIQKEDNPAIIASALNDSIAEGNKQNMFCTMFIGVLDLATGELNFCNAGHNPPILTYADDNGVSCKFMEIKPNIPLGIFEGFEFQKEKISLSHNDILFIYTDGVTEAEDINHNLFGDEKTLSICKSIQQDSTAQEYIDIIYKQIESHETGAQQSDDITMLVVKYLN